MLRRIKSLSGDVAAETADQMPDDDLAMFTADEDSSFAAAEDQPQERRKMERRSLDALREDVAWTFAEDDGRNSGSRRLRVPGQSGLPRSRMLLILVAVIAGGGAAMMAMQRSAPVAEIEQPAPEIVREARMQILVAKERISIGDRISASAIGWEDWPEGSVQSDYITASAMPSAVDEVSGAVARYEFFPGEPIRAQKLTETQAGYLSAVLGAGMRAVSVSVTADSASGGFISPDDHVDVVLTRVPASEIREAPPQSEVILENVRVLAINAQLGRNDGAQEGEASGEPEVFAGQAIATLELDPEKASLIINATRMGSLSLVLRSVADFTAAAPAEPRSLNQTIRMSSPFWAN